VEGPGGLFPAFKIHGKAVLETGVGLRRSTGDLEQGNEQMRAAEGRGKPRDTRDPKKDYFVAMTFLGLERRYSRRGSRRNNEVAKNENIPGGLRTWVEKNRQGRKCVLTADLRKLWLVPRQMHGGR